MRHVVSDSEYCRNVHKDEVEDTCFFVFCCYFFFITCSSVGLHCVYET